jgi:hypothetical protein
MRRLRDALNGADRAHLGRILGEQGDPTLAETRRRHRVNQIASDDTYLADQAVEPFQALSQDERERLISEIIWRVTCFVEGSITKSSGKGVALDSGFRLARMHEGARAVFCVVRKESPRE